MKEQKKRRRQYSQRKADGTFMRERPKGVEWTGSPEQIAANNNLGLTGGHHQSVPASTT